MAIPFKVNFRSLLARRTSTLLTILGVGLPIMVLTLVGALEEGLTAVFRSTGQSENLLVMRSAALSETESFVEREDYSLIASLPEVGKGRDGKPAVSGETVIIINQNRRGSMEGANMIVRGVSAAGYELRPSWKLVTGRPAVPGMSELVASRAMAARFQGCALGETLILRRRPFKVVGLFDTGGTAYDSEVWTDADDLAKTFNRQGYSSLLVRIDDAAARRAFKKLVETDVRLQKKVVGQDEYFEEQTESAKPIQVLVGIMTVVLSVGAAFAAANTMYAAVANRVREIGTMRALGFSRPAIYLGFAAESLILSGLAGAIGCALAALALSLFTGYSGTTNWETFSEVAFSFRLTPGLIGRGMLLALVVGLIGGLLPARMAARLPITTALRDV